MGVDLLRRDLEYMYNNLDRMYNLVHKVFKKTLDALREWRPEDLEDQLYLAETMMNMIEEQATFFIAKYQPLGPELLEAKSLIRVSYDLYRITRYCREINRVITYTSGRIPGASKEVLEAATRSLEMVEKAYRVYRSRDKRLKAEVEEMDDKIDNTYTSMLHTLSRRDEIGSRELVDLLIVRHLERIADHAVYIAQQLLE